MNRRPAVAVLAATLALTVLAACGVQNDTAPRALAPDDVPFDLLAPATSSTSAGPNEGVGSTVWFVDNDGLLARARRNIPPPVTVSAVLTELLAGVSDAEASNGLRTNISSGTQLLGVHGPENGLVTVDLSAEFLTVARELQRLAVAQVVFTVTGLPNVDRVLFQFAGRAAEVPGSGDELTGAPLTRAAFSQFDPSATTTTIQP